MRLRATCLIFLLLLLGVVSIRAEEVALLSSDRVQSTEELRARLKALQEQEAAQETREAIISCFLDQRHLAELLARLPYNHEPPLLRYGDIKRLLKSYLNHERIVELGEAQDLQGWFSIGLLTEYAPVFDEETLSLYLTTPPDQRMQRKIDLQRRHFLDTTGALAPESFSAYVNLNNIYNINEDGHSYRLDLDSALHWNRWVAEARVDVASNEERVVDYRNLRLVRDDPFQATRFTIGETQSFRSRLLISDRIHGVKYAREFSLQPFKVTEPTSEFDFFLERDSTVQVWVNNEEVATLRLRAGPQSILNFPMDIGLNQVVLKITDDIGQRETLVFNSVRGPNLLAEGLTEFAYSAGVRGTGSEYSDEWIVSAFYRRGFTEYLTASLESQWDEERVSLGLGANFASPWVYGALDVASSWNRIGVGTAVRLVLTQVWDNFSLTGRLDFRTRNYLTNGQDLDSVRIKMLNELTALVPQFFLPKLSLRVSYHDGIRWVGAQSRRVEASVDYRFNANWYVGGLFRWDQFASPQVEAQAAITYSHYYPYFQQNHMVRGGTSSVNVRSSLTGSRRNWLGDWSLIHSYIHANNAQDTHNVRGSFRYVGNRFSSFYLGQVGDLGDENTLRHTFNLSTALAFVDGQLALSRPISDSFALIKVGEELGLAELKAYHGGESLVSTHRWPAVVNTLQSYYPEVVNVEPLDPALQIDSMQFLLLPWYRSGFSLKIEQEAGEGGILTASGFLLDHEARPVPLKLILIRRKADPAAEEIRSFTNTEGRFLIPGLRGGALYEVEVWQSPADKLRQSELTYEFTTPEVDVVQGELDVGPLEPTSAPLAPSRPSSLPLPSPESTEPAFEIDMIEMGTVDTKEEEHVLIVYPEARELRRVEGHSWEELYAWSQRLAAAARVPKQRTPLLRPASLLAQAEPSIEKCQTKPVQALPSFPGVARGIPYADPGAMELYPQTWLRPSHTTLVALTLRAMSLNFKPTKYRLDSWTASNKHRPRRALSISRDEHAWPAPREHDYRLPINV